MRKSRRLIPLIVALIAGAMPTPSAAFGAGEWRVISIEGADVLPDADVLVTYSDDGTVSGNADCNTFMGRFVVNGESVLFGPMATTMMICDEPIQNQEDKLLAALNAARGFVVGENNLSLLNASGDVLVVMEPVQ